MVNFRKKLVNSFAIVMAAFVIMGVTGISGTTYAASATNVGVVDFQMLMSQHPDMSAAQETIKTETEQAQKDFNDKIATMANDQEKQNYYNQLQQRLDEKRQALLAAIRDKVVVAIKSVADAKGITVVVDKSAAIYGGQDITNDVGKKITGQ